MVAHVSGKVLVEDGACVEDVRVCVHVCVCDNVCQVWLWLRL